LYAALKHFVLVMNRSLREEYASSGIQFTALCPGPTATEWFGAAQLDSVFAQMPRWLVLSPDRVATLGYNAMMSGRHVVLTGAGASHGSVAAISSRRARTEVAGEEQTRGAGRVKASRGPRAETPGSDAE
jgi:short-subunit dehydrogenase